MTGDQNDIQARLQALTPRGWFSPALVPARDALYAGLANMLAAAYSLLAYVRLQTRISTATDGFLDLIASDYFSGNLMRRLNQSDASYRAAILSAILREKATRNAVYQVLLQLTGQAPIIIEPARQADVTCYGYGGYGITSWGSTSIPFQGFVQTFRGKAVGIPNVAGYGISTGGYSSASWAEYAPSALLSQNLSDSDLYAAIESVRPAGYTLWVAIITGSTTAPYLLNQANQQFVLGSSKLG